MSGLAFAVGLPTVLSLLLSGCGGSSAGKSAGDATSGTKTDPKGSLVIWEHAAPANEKYFRAKYGEYEKQHPGVKIKVLYIPIADLQTKLAAAYGAGNPPDIVKNGAWQMVGFADKGYLSPVDPANFGASNIDGVKAKFEQGSLDPVTFHGNVYGIPTDFNSVSLWYRKDRFQEAGLDPNKPPTTWEQVREYDQKLRSKDGRKVGLQLTRPGQQIWAEMNFLPLVEGLGGSLLNKEGTAGSLSTPEGIKALEYYKGIGNPKLESPNGGFSMFADGTAAMLMGGRFMTGFMPSLNGKLVYGKNYATTTLPAWDGKAPVASGYSWAWSVSKKSENKNTAWNLIGWLNSPENADAQLKATGVVTPAKDWTTKSSAQDEASTVMQKQLPNTSYGPRIPQWNEVMTALSQTLDAVSLGQRTPEQAAKEFDEKVSGILG